MEGIDANELSAAFAESTFFFSYQPVVDLRTAEVPYVEALLRWARPSSIVLNPASFLPLIHGAGLSETLTEWSLATVLTDLPQLRRIYGDEVAVAINLSQRQLTDAHATAALVEAALNNSGERPESLMIEVVEDLTSNDIRRSASAFAGLRSTGVGVVLDDFGTGASSLSVLTDMDYDGLKIDSTFVRGIVSNATARSVIESILAFGVKTGISIVAEGVESALQLQALNDIGCSLGQGFLLGRPAALTEEPGPAYHVPTRIESQRATDEKGDLVALLAEVEEVSPRSTVQTFEELHARLEDLDRQASAAGDGAKLVRCEIGRRMTLASLYAGRDEITVHWAMQTSRLAESLEEWAYSAEVLAMLAAGLGESGESQSWRIEAMTRSMQLRSTKPMNPVQGSGVDNAIGAAFANLGMWDHARRWWSDSVERYRETDHVGTAMCLLNLADLEIQALDGDLSVADDNTPRELSTALIDQLLNQLELNPNAPSGAVAALRSRLALTRGDFEAAVAHVESIEEPAVDILPLFLTLWAEVGICRARGSEADVLATSRKLLQVLDGHPLLRHHGNIAQRIHGGALIDAGQVAEGVELLQQLLRQQHIDDRGRLRVMFEWIRVNVDLNVRFAEFFEELNR